MVIGPPIACCLERKVVTSACSADGGNGALYKLLGMIVSGARQVGGPAGGFGDVLLEVLDSEASVVAVGVEELLEVLDKPTPVAVGIGCKTF